MPAKIPAKWDREVDVVVLGSGAAALSAAVMAHDGGAKVLLLEKAPQFGGTTAVSGGEPWVPNNHHARAKGWGYSREAVLATLQRLTHGKVPDWSLVEHYVDTAPEMLEYLEAHTPLRMYPMDQPDRYFSISGGPKGQTLDSFPFDAKTLGEWAEKCRRSHTFPPLTAVEGGLGGTLMPNLDFELLGKRYEEDIRTMGSGLVASLFKGLLDRGIETLTETPGRELVVNREGAVIGVRAERAGRPFWAAARKGVILGTGGFEWNRELTRAFLATEITHPLSPPYNEGDGLLMATDVGAMLGNMTEAWWMPAFEDPTLEYDGKPLSMYRGARGAAASIIVNKYGKRFTVESGYYNDIPRNFANFDPVAMEYPNLPAWNIFDESVKSTNPIMSIPPDEPAPEWMPQAQTIRELAKKIGVDPEGLEQSVERWNMYANEGVDPDFHRHDLHGVKSKIAPIQKGPFYAMQVHAGALGTKGGPRYNKDAQVINVHGEPIPGLYAAGNAAAGVLGISYPSGGATIGPAMTFGYCAGRAAAKEKPRNLS